MERHIATTPFGRRGLSLAILAGQAAAKGVGRDARAEKWKLFRAVCEAKTMLGASDRALAVLNALLSFYPEAELTGEASLVVFPSNQQLSLRAHGMAPATLRRHLSVLVECGLVVRRDSPNGKRFVRKGQGGDIEQAYGFDLSPLLARAEEFEEMAAAVRAERRALMLTRERMTLYRRDIAKMIAFGLEEGIAADWEGLHLRYRAIVLRLPRTATRLQLEPIEAELKALSASIRKLLEIHANVENPNANESQTGRHKQNSKPEPNLNLEPRSENEPGKTAAPQPAPAEPPQQSQKHPGAKPPTGYPLGLVLRACPDIADYARSGIATWDELVQTANLVRAALGVSPDAWNRACQVMGDIEAAITVAAILQRSDQITSAGGYLRSLTDKTSQGTFALGPVLMALLRAKQNRKQAKTA
jgi:replication initiation protein RepC